MASNLTFFTGLKTWLALCLRFGVSVIALVAAPATIASQQLPVQPGQQVRLTAPECGADNLIDRFWEIRRDTLVLNHKTCPIHSVTSLEKRVDRGVRTSRAVGYPLLGLLGGAVLGASVGFVVAPGCDEDACLAKALATIGGTLLGGTIGLFSGLVMGLQPRIQWVQVPRATMLDTEHRGIPAIRLTIAVVY